MTRPDPDAPATDRPADRRPAVLPGLLAEAGRRFRDGRNDGPAGSMARLAARLAVAFAAVLGLTAGVTLLGKWLAPRGLVAWDERGLAYVVDVLPNHLPLSFTDAIIFESPGNLSYLGPVTLLAALGAAWLGRADRAVAVVAGYGLARLLIWAGWGLWDRARPDTVAGGAAALSAHSFPSGHAILSTTVYGLLAVWLCRASGSVLERAIVVLVTAAWVATVCLARVRLGAHWPSDVVAGVVVGLAWLAAIDRAVER